MKKHHKAIAAVLVACTCGYAAAGGTTAVDVTASVPNVCTFTTAGTMATIALGSMNPSTVPPAGISGTANVTYNCTNGLTPVVTKTAGGTTLTSGTDTISYTFSLGTAEAGLGYATAGSSKVVATATVTQANVQAAKAGSYTDTVTLSINN